MRIEYKPTCRSTVTARCSRCLSHELLQRLDAIAGGPFGGQNPLSIHACCHLYLPGGRIRWFGFPREVVQDRFRSRRPRTSTGMDVRLTDATIGGARFLELLGPSNPWYCGWVQLQVPPLSWHSSVTEAPRGEKISPRALKAIGRVVEVLSHFAAGLMPNGCCQFSHHVRRRLLRY